MRRYLIPSTMIAVIVALGATLVFGGPPELPAAWRKSSDAPVKADAPKEPAKGAALKKFKKGAKPTPRHKIFSAKQFIRDKNKALPTSVAYVPKQLSMWLNDTFGDCVTAEEAFNQDCVGVFIQDATVQTWANANGFLDGANLTDVMDAMAKSGFSQGGSVYGDGPYSSVNYSDEPTLQASLALAPVKIGIDSTALPGTAGNQMGWYASGGTVGQFSNEDHCVSLAGFGPVATMFSAVGVSAVPADWPASSTTAYLLFTWDSIGVVDHNWIVSTCAEAWLRQPTATVNGTPQPNPGPAPNPNPTPVPPTPTPTPTPTPNPNGFTGSVTYTYAGGVLTGVTTGPPSTTVAADLAAAGVNPVVILDVLQLLTDLKSKASAQVLAEDMLKILTDIAAPKKVGRREEPCPWALAA